MELVRYKGDINMVLKEKQVCPYASTCKYNLTHKCWGAIPNRNTTFTCHHVDEDGFTEGNHSNPMGKTGTMHILME